jgi:hypothetical protein
MYPLKDKLNKSKMNSGLIDKICGKEKSFIINKVMEIEFILDGLASYNVPSTESSLRVISSSPWSNFLATPKSLIRGFISRGGKGPNILN